MIFIAFQGNLFGLLAQKKALFPESAFLGALLRSAPFFKAISVFFDFLVNFDHFQMMVVYGLIPKMTTI